MAQIVCADQPRLLRGLNFLSGESMFELKPIARHLLLACGGLAGAILIASPASAQQAQGQEQKLERITITGSNIRRTDTETVAPVEIITREEIEKSGKATVADVLRSIPANTGNSYSESFSNSFAPGASGISLRGLGQKATLVLINGRRTAGYGFAQNLQDTFVDLNSLPSSAIERIEVLKDGASAIYGSDAIAGVVNVIMRRDFKGAEVSAGAGFFEGKDDYRASIVGGFGDLGSDKFNVFGVLDFYKRDLVMLADTKFGESRDFRGEQGGRNFESLTGGGTWRALNATGTAFTNTWQAISGCNGQILNVDQAIARGLFLANNATFNTPGNTFCSKDFNYAFTAVPSTERIGALTRGTFDFTPTIQGFFEGAYSNVESFQRFQEPFFAGTTGLLPTAAGLSPFTYNVTFAPGVAGNPFATPARYNGVLNDLGTRDTEIESETLRLLGGLKYSLMGWDAETAIGWSENEVTANNVNRLSKAGVSAVFGVPTGPFPPTPTATGSTYNLDQPGLNSPAVRSQMLINVPRRATSELQFVDTRASTEIGSLPGGAIGLALGAEYRSEKLNDEPDARAEAGDILGQGITATDGSRHNLAIFTELALPLTNTLEAQLALRNDSYSDFGSALTPKIGMKWRPTGELLFRANWGRGFRAPTLPEISPSVATFFIQVIDPTQPPATQVTQVSGVFAGNPNLDAEKSRSTTVGFVWEPSNNLNFAVDWYELNWSNIVGSDSFQSIVNSGDSRVIRDPSTGLIVTVLNNFRNFSSQTTNGFDFDMRHRLPTVFGRFTTRLNTSYVNKYEVEGDEYAGDNGFTSIPRLRGFLSLDWEQGPFTVTGRVNYIHSYEQQLLPGSYFTPQDPRFQNGTYPNRIESYTTLDLFGRWNVTPKISVSASINNVTDETPPYDPGASATFLYDFTQYSPFGRTYRVGATYRF
jgi:iron complex outermembrane recepter protein